MVRYSPGKSVGLFLCGRSSAAFSFLAWQFLAACTCARLPLLAGYLWKSRKRGPDLAQFWCNLTPFRINIYTRIPQVLILKPFTRNLNPLDATLTKNRGRRADRARVLDTVSQWDSHSWLSAFNVCGNNLKGSPKEVARRRRSTAPAVSAHPIGKRRCPAFGPESAQTLP